MCTTYNARTLKSKKNTMVAELILPLDFKPTTKDILCGRGNVYSNHPGNQDFGVIIRSNIDQYNNASNRQEKIKVVHKILDSIRTSGARFVKTDTQTKRAYELNDVQAHQKIGHAIRDTIRLLKDKTKSTAIILDTTTTSTTRSRVAMKRLRQEMGTETHAPFISPSPSTLSMSEPEPKRRMSAIEEIVRLGIKTAELTDDIRSISAVVNGESSSSSEYDNHNHFNNLGPQQQHPLDRVVHYIPPIVTTTKRIKPVRNANSQSSYRLPNEFPDNDIPFTSSNFFDDCEPQPRQSRSFPRYNGYDLATSIVID